MVLVFLDGKMVVGKKRFYACGGVEYDENLRGSYQMYL